MHKKHINAIVQDNNKRKRGIKLEEPDIICLDDEDNSNEKNQRKEPILLVDPNLELTDPCPNIKAMLIEFDRLYFYSKIGTCRIEWSKRMTRCAGYFYSKYNNNNEASMVIRLSEPLLKFRPRQNLVETLLHEMIHAYMFATSSQEWINRSVHGNEFKSHMNRINQLAKTNVTVYHDFYDEMNYCKKHVWKCNGVRL